MAFQPRKLGGGVSRQLAGPKKLGGGSMLLGAARAAAEAAAKEKAEERLAREIRDAARNLNESVKDVASRLMSEIQTDFYLVLAFGNQSLVLVFQTSEQRFCFEKFLGVRGDGDGLFLDGLAVSKRLGVPSAPAANPQLQVLAFRLWAAVPEEKGGLFLDGEALARKLEVPNLPNGPEEWREADPSKLWASFALPVVPRPLLYGERLTEQEPEPETTTAPSEDEAAEDESVDEG